MHKKKLLEMLDAIIDNNYDYITEELHEYVASTVDYPFNIPNTAEEERANDQVFLNELNAAHGQWAWFIATLREDLARKETL